MIQENQMKMIMAAIKRGDIAALDQLKREFPAGEEVEEFDYVEVDWTLTYDKEKRHINVFWDAKVKLEGGHIDLAWCVIYNLNGNFYPCNICCILLSNLNGFS